MPSFDPTLTWSDDELLDVSKLAAMTDNDNALYNTVPHYYQTTPKITRDFDSDQAAVLKPVIASGIFTFSNMNGAYGQVRAIYFPPNAFAGNCTPAVVATPLGASLQSRMTCVIAPLSGGLAQIDSRGFKVFLYQRDGLRFDGNAYLHWVAHGWENTT
jgi:hypothetical protein